MWIRRILPVCLGMLLAFAAFLPSARADEWNQMTKFSFSQPVELPHFVLPAGSYWFVLAPGPAECNLVQVFSSDWSQMYGTLITVPTLRQETTNRTEVTFAERPSHSPEALLKWYYPGRFLGHEFLYPQRQENEFHHDAKQDAIGHQLKIRS